ncbi:hypothetical protein RJ639_018500 [Escallonia herrerae]|uniref:Pentatricopeptide repeat-containing protein n=1 Tax=Escallonia herrerae TaxID=1293975 RepID=A0AA88V7W5_9ASTE|nr:hypothetical protein RJ639_018500 [Escallonia herrerae]
MFTPAISLTTTIPALTNTATSLPINPKQQNPLHTTLKSLSRSGKLEEALSLIEFPPSKPTTSQPDLDTYSSLLHACISQKSLHHGQRLYLHLLLPRNKHLLYNPILKTKLITLYAVCGQIDEARRIFYDGIGANGIPESVWVAMAIGYSRNGCFQEALVLYCDMLWGCVRPGVQFERMEKVEKGCKYLTQETIVQIKLAYIAILR